ncbi:trigger factor [Blautia difficilis]|uniref:peptidylprolyl isomerase n=1 Tax=Blautia difficilis TaxID=2763027 RepID=A0ABR7ILI4_9FIRM|nr:trigger factor [Blautia difficilis]MBC5780800.1 trigger factor [Blautia difficilis]
MKKRIYLAMLAACLALTVTGCGESGKTGTDTAETQENSDGKTVEAGVSRLVSVDNVDKYITLGEYKGLILDNTVEVITDDDVQARIDQELQDKAEAVSDGAQEGDLVTVNYVGTIDGETFDGGTANNYDFIIGNGGMFQEFEQGVIGMKKGETKEISIDFPSDYSDSTLAGKKADYKVTVQNVRRAPELTDEWVTKNTDYTTVEEYREGTRKTLEKEARESAGEVLKNTAWNTVLENTEVKEYPEADVENAISEFRKSMEVYAKQADMTLEEFVESQGISKDAFDEQSRQYAEGKVKQNLIVQGIMDAEGLSLDDKESLKVQEELVKQMGAANLAELVDTYGQSYVDESVGLLRVEDFIVKNAQVSEKAANGDTVADNAEGAAEQAEDSASGDSQTEESEVDQNLEDELGTETE